MDGQRRESSATEGTTEKGAVSPPSISLPKGGGAIRGIGEKFAANPVTGTGSLSVPLAVSPGRSGFGPQLSLSYDSGAGNGPFGFGWSLSLPAITRKTDKGLPRYRDAEESDVFLLSGAEDLVPIFKQDANGDWVVGPDGKPKFDEDERDGFTVRRYRPRIEGLFARIERWTSVEGGDVHWRSISRDNVTTLYGATVESRIADPAELGHVFSWLICESYDDRGNAVRYEYKAEDAHGVEPDQVYERNRVDFSRPATDPGRIKYANRYLKRIRYGNRTPRKPGEDLGGRGDWLFDVVFDYGEHYREDDRGQPSEVWFGDQKHPWSNRQDPFSSYRAGFEVRTHRLCRRVLMFHHFDELGTEDCLVRATHFDYRETPIASFIRSVTQSGYVFRGGRYLKKSLPPLEFDYTRTEIQSEVHELAGEDLENLPVGLDGALYEWVDLDGEGLSGILSRQDGAWYYKRNLSPVNANGQGSAAVPVARFAPLERVARIPALASSSGGGQQFLDLAGDGQQDLVQLEGPVAGFFERTGDADWAPFVPFDALPNLDWDDPNLRFVDLTGDGHADVLISHDEVFTWHPSLAEAGYGAGERVAKPWDEEKGPRLVFADGTQSVYLADFSGDGLSDLARVRNGEVCYWPNLGYGRFGARVTMDNGPWFDAPDLFDQRRIRLADIDGSGVTDIIYLSREGVHIYLNQSGNGWSERQALAAFPEVDNLSAVQAVDLLGNGTACLVWSSPLPGSARRPLRYVDLMGGQKPHLLERTRNNLGAETVVHYAPSTKFYVKDRLEGKPWATRLPFPVHVVERVETFDHISRNRFVTCYAYHHGYFDGYEREFRGFGMVEQWDTEDVGYLELVPPRTEASNFEKSSFVPPVHTKTWFHTGAWFDGREISRQLAYEYFGAPARDAPDFEGAFAAFEQRYLLNDTLLPEGLTTAEQREACRALKGAVLRVEVYADDLSPRRSYPYSVSESNYAIKHLQPQGRNRHAVFFTHAHEAITMHYERDPDDPRISHALTLEVDAFGNPLKSVAVGYGRKPANVPFAAGEREKRDPQTTTLITYTENAFTEALTSGADVYRGPLPAETRMYELTGYTPSSVHGRFVHDDFAAVQVGPRGRRSVRPIFDGEARYEDQPGAGRRRRLIEHVRTLYRKDDLSALLPLGRLDPLALPGESYTLAFTPGLLEATFVASGKMTMAELTGALAQGGAYRSGDAYKASSVGLFPNSDPDGPNSDPDGLWWIPSGQIFYSENSVDAASAELAVAVQHFFLPVRFRDPFGSNTTVRYDPYNLLVLETADALNNRVTAGERDARGTVSPNGNDYRTLQPGLVTDANGNRVAVAFDALGLVVGTAVMGKTGGNLGDSLQDFRTDLSRPELDAFFAAPASHAHDLLSRATTRIVYDVESFRETDNPVWAATLARETHASDSVTPEAVKIQQSFLYSDGFGRELQQKIQAEAGSVERRHTSTRWVGSGWTEYNNKGKPFRKYEPFFSATHRFERNPNGVYITLFYDPAERLVATLYPNHTYEKVVFSPWHQETWDVNDTVLQSDPALDADVGAYLEPLLDARPGPYTSWHDQRIGGQPGSSERDAAEKAAAHRDTPTVTHLDALGRPYLTVADNGSDGQYETRTELDIEGKPLAVIDALGRPVMAYASTIRLPGGTEKSTPGYDLAGNQLYQKSMDAGERWVLSDAAGKPMYRWDSRGFRMRYSYDALQRPTHLYVRGEGSSAERLAEFTLYGEEHPDANPPRPGQAAPGTLNLRGRVLAQLDGAGLLINMGWRTVFSAPEAYDFKGNLLRSTRTLTRDAGWDVDWSATEPQLRGYLFAGTGFGNIVRAVASQLRLNSRLQAEDYVSSTRYDALNRPVQVIAPHVRFGRSINVIQPLYNEANLLERVDVWLERRDEPTTLLDPATASLHAVTNIDYNEKGQRERIEYGVRASNGTLASIQTDYRYDSDTFRLMNLETTRTTDGKKLQDLSYSYDPVGNITSIRDVSQDCICHNNQKVSANQSYCYDPLYRLSGAEGREHIGQVTNPQPTHDDGPRENQPCPNDGQAMRRYLEQYTYDEVGNILKMTHRHGRLSNPGQVIWNRRYQYRPDSNRLLSTSQPNEPDADSYSPLPLYRDRYEYDPHGNMNKMPHLGRMDWDFKDQLSGFKEGTTEALYAYNASGQRVRKVVKKNDGRVVEERIYLGGFEIFRRLKGTNKVTRETLHIMDDQQRIALVETRTEGREADTPRQLVRYQLGNQLGSTSLELDGSGEIITFEEYYPYGSTSYQAVRKQTETPKRYRYTGKERDEESGFYYHGARYYAPWLGRWLSPDPSELEESLNFYAYVHNAPSIHVDPDGRQTAPSASNLLNSGTYRLLDTTPGFTREHVIPGKQFYWYNAQEYGQPAAKLLHERLYANEEAILTANRISSEKTRIDHRQTAEFRAAFKSGLRIDIRDLFLRNLQNFKEAARTAGTPLNEQEVTQVKNTMRKQVASVIKAEPSHRAAQAGEPVNRVLSNQLAITEQTVPNQAAGKVAVTNFQKVEAPASKPTSGKAPVTRSRSGGAGRALVFMVLLFLVPDDALAAFESETLERGIRVYRGLAVPANNLINPVADDPTQEFIGKVLQASTEPGPGIIQLMERHGYGYEGMVEGKPKWIEQPYYRKINVR